MHTNISEYVKFSDGKAGILLTSSGVLLTLVLRWAADRKFDFGVVQLSAFVTCLIFLSLSFVLFFYSVYPRIKAQRSDSLVFWESVLQRQRDGYVKAISDLDVDKILSEVSIDIYNTSKVAHKKYLIVKWGMITLGIALIFVIMLWLSTIEFPLTDP